MKKILALCTLMIFCLGLQGFAANSSSSLALATVKQEISKILSNTSKPVNDIGKFTTYASDFRKVLNKFTEVASPKPVVLENKIVKYLVPLRMNSEKVGGFFQVSADGKTIISMLPWKPNLEPLFQVSSKKWESVKVANEISEIAELFPKTFKPTAGEPVEFEDLTDVFIIDNISSLPSKTQEEKRDFATRAGFEAPTKRRYGSLKCLSYAASFVADWWKMQKGMNLGSYKSILTGGQEYGTDPRMVESLYFATPKSPYSFLKYNIKKDLVTKEKVPYSPKHYAYVLSCIKLPGKIKDPLLKKSHVVPDQDMGMDSPFYTVFNRSKGTIKLINQSLKSYGILLSQHTMRIPGDKKPLKFIGIHSIAIVGTAKLRGKEVVLYYETFGKNHKEYIEDGFFGPALRAFPVGFFYQGIAFPHPLKFNAQVKNGKFIGSFATNYGQKLVPDNLLVELDGNRIKVKRSSSFSLPIDNGVHKLKIIYNKRYYQTPEEPTVYKRSFVIADGRIIELSELENVTKSLTKAKRSIAFWRHKKDGYNEFLLNRHDSIRDEILMTLKSSRSNSKFLTTVKTIVDSSKYLKKSLSRSINAILGQN
jgi:hypothetical protein